MNDTIRFIGLLCHLMLFIICIVTIKNVRSRIGLSLVTIGIGLMLIRRSTGWLSEVGHPVPFDIDTNLLPSLISIFLFSGVLLHVLNQDSTIARLWRDRAYDDSGS